MKINLEQKWIDLIRIQIKKILPNTEIFIFGSRSKKDNRNYSDIDIALKAKEKIDLKNLSILKYNIEDTDIPCKIDIVDLNNCEEKFLLEIKKDLKKI